MTQVIIIVKKTIKTEKKTCNLRETVDGRKLATRKKKTMSTIKIGETILRTYNDRTHVTTIISNSDLRRNNSLSRVMCYRIHKDQSILFRALQISRLV